MALRRSLLGVALFLCSFSSGSAQPAHSSDPTPLIVNPVIPVITIENARDAVPLARALLASGLRVVEITLRTPAALDAIRAVADEIPDVIVGAGTVLTPPDITRAVDAGLAGGAALSGVSRSG